MADVKFHLFVRKHAAGVSVSVMTMPHLCAFAGELPAARADLTRVLARLIERGELGEGAHFDDARLRRVDLKVRAWQRGRLLEVPMRFSVLTYGKKPARVLVPRLGLEGRLDDLVNLSPYVEELVRHALFGAPLERLLDAAYTGEESLDELVVSARPREPEPPPKPEARRAPPELPPGLGEACRRLDAEARGGQLDRAYCRDGDVNQLLNVINAKTRASALLIGPPSVGKTAIVHELAHRLADKSHAAHGLELYSTTAGRIVAGMRYLGEWQARVQRMIDELRTRRAALHLESLAELVALGAGHEGLDVARYFLPAVESGEIALILEATPDDLARAERTHSALVHALKPLRVAALEPVAARSALSQAAARIARTRRAHIAEAALDRALDLTERFGDGVLPGGAVELVRAAMHEGNGAAGERTVGVAEVTAAFSARTGYPRELVDPDVPLDPKAVLASFAARVIGQPDAMQLFANLVVTLKTNLADPSRPLGSFLLLGPTGVGKTETALGLAAYLFGDEKRLARFDMAEYAAPGSAHRLVATSGAESTLAKRVREQPFGVVLLDEIEKADAGVHDLLLQILGEGRMTDGTGRTVSFRNTIVVLTSNLGADSAGRSLGFAGGGAAAHEAHYRGAAAAFFRPELLNRFDAVVPYRPLSPEVIAMIARRALEQALAREGLARRGVTVDFDDAVVAALAAVGFDARLGARPLRRAVEEHVVAPLARLLAAESRRPPKRVRLAVDAGGGIRVIAQ